MHLIVIPQLSPFQLIAHNSQGHELMRQKSLCISTIISTFHNYIHWNGIDTFYLFETNNPVKVCNSVSFKTNTEIQYSYSVDKKPNTFLNYSYSVIRNEYQ